MTDKEAELAEQVNVLEQRVVELEKRIQDTVSKQHFIEFATLVQKGLLMASGVSEDEIAQDYGHLVSSTSDQPKTQDD